MAQVTLSQARAGAVQIFVTMSWALALAVVLPHACYGRNLPPHLSNGDLARVLGFDRIEKDAEPPGKLGYLEVPLNHFAKDSPTWMLKYWVNDTAFKSGGDLIVNMPGEGAGYGCPSSSLDRSLAAIAVCAQHRFFGDSVPNNSSTVENLQFLSVEQNLADQIALVKHMRTKYPSVSKVLAKGGSYSGASAAWIRHAYPEVIDAAIAYSPPVTARIAFPEYDTSNLVALSSPDNRCAQTLAKTNEAIERQLASNRTAIMQLFNATYQITSDLGDTDFAYGMGDSTASAVQYGQKQNLCTFLEPLYDQTVSDVTYVEVFANYTEHQFGPDYFSGCFYNSTCMKTSTHGPVAQSARSWYWFKCTELGYLQVAPQHGLSTRPRSFNVEAALNQCKYIFPGAKLISDESVAHFNKKFGAGTVGSTSNIFELDFSDDPWKMSSSVELIQRDEWMLTLNQPYLYLTCDGCAHCGAGVPNEKYAAIQQQVFAALKGWGFGASHAYPQALMV